MTFRVVGRGEEAKPRHSLALDGSVVFTSLLLDISAFVLWVAKFKTSMDPSTTKLEKGLNVL